MAKKKAGDELHRIHQELKGGEVYPVYLLYGAEGFVVSQAMEAVQRHVLEGIPVDFNFDQFHGKDCEPERVVDAAMMLPTMARRRLVLLRDAFDLKPAGLKALVDYVKRPSPTSVLLMTAGEVPRRRGAEEGGSGGKEDGAATGAMAPDRGGREDAGKTAAKATIAQLIRASRKTGRVVEFRTYYERDVMGWIRGEIARRGKTIDGRTITCLIDMVGRNLGELHAELAKVCLFVGERKAITLDDLQEVVSDVKPDDIWAFTNAVGAKKAGEALLHLKKMTDGASGAAVQGRLISTLHRHFVHLYRAKKLDEEGVPYAEVAKRLDVRSNIVWLWKDREWQQAKRLSNDDILEALKALYQASLALRTSKTPAEVQLEALILRLCRR